MKRHFCNEFRVLEDAPAGFVGISCTFVEPLVGAGEGESIGESFPPGSVVVDSTYHMANTAAIAR